MKNKNIALSIVVWLLVVVLISIIVFGYLYRTNTAQMKIDDGIEQIDLNTIYLENSDVEVNFSDVLLSNQKETRKLIVSTQEAKVTTTLTDRLIEKIDYDFMKKTQTVSYKGKGYFVVDLSNLSKRNIIDDKDNKTVTIKIPHAKLETITIDPNKVIIDEVKQSLLARGAIELTVADYNTIEKELISRLDAKFNTVKNIQEADKLALQAVKAIYEPIVKAIDWRYEVIVEFQ